MRDLTQLEGFAEKSARKLVDQIAGARTLELHRFLYALGIPGIGVSVARDLAEQFGTLAALRAASVEALARTPGLGAKRAAAVHAFFRDARSRRVIDGLLRAGVRVAGERRRQGALAGKRVVFTGALSSRTRADAKKLVESIGGRVTERVGPNVDFVVVGASPGEKLDEARRLGVREMSEREFLGLLRKAGVGT